MGARIETQRGKCKLKRICDCPEAEYIDNNIGQSASENEAELSDTQEESSEDKEVVVTTKPFQLSTENPQKRLKR
ncbi:uncharacterized protein N7479_002921 [Penicillium vulpinum]|uniref:uncharacterized protein n=1 Tax=Penicillium vulpinum TaxID=29845 RepID=UPI0025466913|nr:uncharacterized protein N7479_002921 [Penicillium vulpinum]KAJ5973003.1 hypothetical protein N7479_002921 [Penicillium vulpinum]